MPCRSPTPSPVMPEPCPPCGCPGERSRNHCSEVSFSELTWPAAPVPGCYSNPPAVSLPYRCCNVVTPLVTYHFLLFFMGVTPASLYVCAHTHARTRGRVSLTPWTPTGFHRARAHTRAGQRYCCNSCSIRPFSASELGFLVLQQPVAGVTAAVASRPFPALNRSFGCYT